MCVCVCTRLTSPWREWSGRRRLEGGSSTLRGPGTGACERLEETHRHTHKHTLGEVSGLRSNELFALLVLWEPGIKRRDTLDTSRTLLFPPCRRNVCVCVCDAAVCVGPSTGSWCRQLVSLVYSTRVTSCGKKRSPHFENTHRHTPKHAHKQTISTYFISTFSRNVFQQKKHRQLDSVPSHSKYPVSLGLPLCALQRKSFVNRQHLALSAARLLTCVCSRGMLSMTVIWPRLRACFRTPSHYKSGRQECDWVSRPVSPLRSFLPSLSLSHHALPPSSSSSPPPSSFSCSPPPFHWADLLSRSFSPLFYLLPLCSLFPRLPSFITTLFLSSPILPRVTELLYGLSQIHCRLLLCLVWFFALPPWQIHVNKQAVLHQQQNHSLICHIFTTSTLQLS